MDWSYFFISGSRSIVRKWVFLWNIYFSVRKNYGNTVRIMVKYIYIKQLGERKSDCWHELEYDTGERKRWRKFILRWNIPASWGSSPVCVQWSSACWLWFPESYYWQISQILFFNQRRIPCLFYKSGKQGTFSIRGEGEMYDYNV